MRAVTEALLALLEAGEEGALATVVKTSGSTPQAPGARLLLLPGDRRVGTVGGGAIERLVIDALREVQTHGVSRVVACDLGRDLGMCCGGSMEIFIEPIVATPRLWIFGAGHVAQPTAALARTVGFDVVVVDEREELNVEERFPGCRRELIDPASALGREPIGPRDWLLIVTHDHLLDEESLRAALAREPRYIGVVGSRRKIYRLLERIAARQGPLELERIYAPVGLDLGAISPQEIAVSIVAELIAVRHAAKSTGHLRAVDDERLRERLTNVTAPGPALVRTLGAVGARSEDGDVEHAWIDHNEVLP
jgi:xanthine dehydrogenase accessory factor